MKFFILEPEFDDSPLPNPRIREATSWRMLTELLRRYPNDFRFLEWHPGGGTKDLLTLVNRRGAVDEGVRIDLNRRGPAQVHRDGNIVMVWQNFWSDALRVSDPKVVVDVLAAEANLVPVHELPAASAEVVMGRVVAATLAATMLDRSHWDCVSGFEDTSGYGGGVRDDLFEDFPAAKRRVSVSQETDMQDQPGYRFWFLRRDEGPQVAFELWDEEATAWDREGQEHNLVALYRSSGRSRVWPVVTMLVGGQF